MKLSEKKRQELHAEGSLKSFGGRLFIAVDALDADAKLASDTPEEKAVSVPAPKDDGKK